MPDLTLEISKNMAIERVKEVGRNSWSNGRMERSLSWRLSWCSINDEHGQPGQSSRP